MREEGRDGDAFDPPEVRVKHGRRVSAVWIVPALALIIGGWLAYETVSKMGPEIEIVLDTASGLEAGKTQVKYKDVVIGRIVSVALDPTLRTVTAIAEMEKTAEPLLTETTRFWVVRPRLAAKEISGLGTLVSGAYVELDPGSGGKENRRFVALEEPPVVRADMPGVEIVLAANDLGSLSRGSPIYFRGIAAGEVMGYELAEDKKRVLIHGFIHSPHDRLVRPATRFWNVSGFQFSVDADGVKVGTGTLQSLILGGIAFETPDLLTGTEPVRSGARFDLFASRETVRDSAYAETAKFILFFDSSVRGLSIGAPVEFRGIKIGSVVDVRLEFNPQTAETYVPVLIKVELDRTSILDSSVFGPQSSKEERQSHLDRIIEKGLRARLKTGNFLTGQLVVDLDMHPDAPINLVGKSGDYIEIPTLPQQIEEISNSVTELIAKLQRLPFDTISKKLVSTLDGADRLVHSTEIEVALTSLRDASRKLESILAGVDGKLVPGAAIALEQADTTLKKAEQAMVSAESVLRSVDSMVSDESAFRYETLGAIQEISAAARSIRQFTEYLQRNPNALLTGKSPQ